MTNVEGDFNYEEQLEVLDRFRTQVQEHLRQVEPRSYIDFLKRFNAPLGILVGISVITDCPIEGQVLDVLVRIATSCCMELDFRSDSETYAFRFMRGMPSVSSEE